MRNNWMGWLSATTVATVIGGAALADSHGLAMYGEPALGPDYEHLPYVNPNAPTGGEIVTGEVGTFDSLNPFIRKGSVPWQLRFFMGESLMGRSWDEPFTVYCLLCETVETPDDRSWVEFTLREEARFSDGSPVTVEDVIWSYETLGTEGHPRYAGLWTKIESIEATGDRSVRITFNVEDRELALIAGMRPILKKDQWEGIEFAESGLDVIPITSSPYMIGEYDAGRSITLVRNPDYWGRDLPFRRGTNNIDRVRLEFFLDGTAQFEAFKSGIITSNREFNANKWANEYNFGAIQDGDVVLSVLPHQRPTGITGFVMNTRMPPFDDWRVREAMMLAFNFEFINAAMTNNAQPRITSYFSNSPLGMRPGAAEGRVLELLEPFADELLPGAIEGYELPVSDGSERNRANIRAATAILAEAGWTPDDQGVMRNEAGEELTFEIVLETGSSENEAIISMFVESLARLGITPTVTQIDDAQYSERTDTYDFGMTFYRRGLSLSPGNEQYLYWGSDGVTEPGTRNYMGMNSPAAEAMINEMLNAASHDDFVAAVRALDRILTSGRYVIPIYQYNISRIAHSKNLHYPETLPIYGDWIGFQPDVWWYEEN